MNCIKSLVVLMFFVTYVTFQPPSTILIRKIGPPKFLSSIILSWGILMLVSLHGDLVGIFLLINFRAWASPRLGARFWPSVYSLEFLPLGIFRDACICSLVGIFAVSCLVLFVASPDTQLTNLLVTIASDEVQKRFSVFYGVGCVASALAGILAFGLMHMDGIQGISGWRWILIMEGVVRYEIFTLDILKA